MSHVDEGLLHAVLDGALDALGPEEAERARRHLAACEHCRARLEAERRVRDRAHEILKGSGPLELREPPFAELRGEAVRRRSPLPGATALAWAASVALALGLGWLARERLAGAPVEIAVLAPTAAAPRAPEAAPADAPAGRRAAAATASADRAVDASPSPATPAATAVAPVESPAPAALATVDAPPERVSERQAAPAALAPTFAPAPPPEEARRLASERVTDTTGQPLPGALEARTFGGTEAAEWAPASLRQAARRLGGPVLLLPDAAVEEVSTGRVNGAPAVRVVQRLPDGTRVELLQQREPAQGREPVAAAAPAPPPPADDARSERGGAGPSTVRVQHAGVRVEARAALPAAALRALLETLR